MTQHPILRGFSEGGGVRAAAQLLRAAGPHAEMVFAQLTQAETRAIHQQMDHLSTEQSGVAPSALEAFLLETSQSRSGEEAPSPDSVWSCLTKAHAPMLAAMVGRESPHVSAWIISRLDPHLAASVVRMLGDEVGLSILKRILNSKVPPQSVADLIELSLQQTMERLGSEHDTDGHEKIARIFDQLDTGQDDDLLSQLDAIEPAAAERVRALMFTFDDLVAFDAAGMQTLIATTHRDVLVKALKGSRPEISNVFYSNLTRRAGALIRQEIDSIGPLRLSDINAARGEIVDRARQLIQSGDILLKSETDHDALVE
ncbi:MAG: FliG C-terminal domain-containing protein [Pseudomonadota bacterium]